MPADIALTIFNLEKSTADLYMSEKYKRKKISIFAPPYHLLLITYYLKNVGNARFGLGDMPWRI